MTALARFSMICAGGALFAAAWGGYPAAAHSAIAAGTLDGGGQAAFSENYAVCASLGQPGECGALSSPSYAAKCGFWPAWPVKEDQEGEGTDEGTPEGSADGEGHAEGNQEGEGSPEGIPDGEGIPEGIVEGTAEGEGQGEGEGEGTAEGEGEGVPEGEGPPEGSLEGEGVPEGSPEGTEEGELGPHAADQNGDGLISLTELLRVIQFFNAQGYHCVTAPVISEDGYLPGPGSNHTCVVHSSDYNPQNWQISLTELLRLIQFFNSGGYHACPGQGTEDGYCPGPA